PRCCPSSRQGLSCSRPLWRTDLPALPFSSQSSFPAPLAWPIFTPSARAPNPGTEECAQGVFLERARLRENVRGHRLESREDEDVSDRWCSYCCCSPAGDSSARGCCTPIQ